MLYVPIKIYPNESSVRACVIIGATFLGVAVAGFLNIQADNVRLIAMLICMVGACMSVISAVAAMTRQPMFKVLDDRFSVYTPFGYALVRFGEVLSFKKGGLPGMRTLRVDINRSARPRFPSSVGRLLYCLVWLSFTNSVAIQGYMLGAELDSVIKMLENRRLAAVRLDAIEGYDPTGLTTAA
ncbi:MAG: hypothetical protein OCC46_15100 [Pseudodesulfovibrio sp.]